MLNSYLKITVIREEIDFLKVSKSAEKLNIKELFLKV